MLMNNKGTTLIELMIGMAIFGLITFGMVNIFKSSNALYQSTINQSQSVPKANSALLLISSELQQSSNISLSNNGQQINYTYPTTPTTARTIYYDQTKKTIIFTQDGSITSTVGAGTVSSLLFTENVITPIEYTIAIQYNSSSITTNAISVSSNIVTGGL